MAAWHWSAAVYQPGIKPAAAVASYVGEERCAQCHAEQVNEWRTSHHAQAMQVTSDSSVLGDFNRAHFAK
jgi:hypothetical protein